MKKRKKVIPPIGYYLNVKSHFLLLPMTSKHTTSQKVLGIFKFPSCFISDLYKHMSQTYKTLMSQTSSTALQKEYAMCFLFYRGSYTKQTSSIKISAFSVQIAISYCNINLHTI